MRRGLRIVAGRKRDGPLHHATGRLYQTPPIGGECAFLEAHAKADGGGPAVEVATVAAAVHAVVFGAGHEFEFVAVDVVVQAEVGGMVAVAAAAVGQAGSEAFVAALEAEPVVVTAGILVATDDLELVGDVVCGDEVDAEDVALRPAAGGTEDFGADEPSVFCCGGVERECVFERAAAGCVFGIGAVLVVEADECLVEAGLLLEVVADVGLDDCAVGALGEFAFLVAGVESGTIDEAVLLAVYADAGEFAGEEGV